jgi:hypothetical protein
MQALSLAAIFRLHVSIDGVEPTVWRRVRVRSDETLSGLHEILQLAMGWSNSHVHLFETEDGEYGEAAADWDVRDEAGVAVHAVLRRPADSITYVYDMGDDWRHTVLLESVTRDEDPDQEVPYCEAGERACPPEDTGGAWRFMNMLEALPDPSHPDHEEWAEWIGSFDPDAFPIGMVNRLLLRYAERSRRTSSDRLRRSSSDRQRRPASREKRRHQSRDTREEPRGDDYRPSARVDAIIDAACSFMRRDEFFREEAFERATQLLVLYDAGHPGTIDRANKPLGWAAGAVHAAILTLPEYRDWTADPPTLAKLFGVSEATIRQKSQALRRHLEAMLEHYDIPEDDD